MRFTVLGMYGPFPAPEGAGSGYYVEAQGARVLIDCGPGVLGRVQRFCRLQDLSCVVLSHWHADHASDLLAMGYAVNQLRADGKMDHTIRLIAPQTPSSWRALLPEGAFTLAEAQDQMRVPVQGLDIELHAMTHPVPTFAVKCIERNGRTLVYSADTTFNGRLIALALKADLFLCDSGIPQADAKENAPHLTCLQAGQAASVAQARALMLTHINPLYDPLAIRAEAALHYPEAVLAEELRSYQV